MPLYHVRVFIPSKLELPKGEFKLSYTEHAMMESKRDRYGNMELPKTLHTNECRVIEVETDNSNKVCKVVYKRRLDRDRDLVLAVIPSVQTMIVKTVWINEKKDFHKTLDTSRYSRQPI